MILNLHFRFFLNVHCGASNNILLNLPVFWTFDFWNLCPPHSHQNCLNESCLLYCVLQQPPVVHFSWRQNQLPLIAVKILSFKNWDSIICPLRSYQIPPLELMSLLLNPYYLLLTSLLMIIYRTGYFNNSCKWTWLLNCQQALWGQKLWFILLCNGSALSLDLPLLTD